MYTTTNNYQIYMEGFRVAKNNLPPIFKNTPVKSIFKLGYHHGKTKEFFTEKQFIEWMSKNLIQN